MLKLNNTVELNNTVQLENITELENAVDLSGNILLNLISKYGVPALLLDNSTVFTDVAGITPAGIGDVVGNESDQSDGGHDISQATGAKKPILRDGPLLEFDGADDLLSSVNAFTGDEITIIFCGKYRSAPASTKTYFGAGDSGNSANYLSLFGNSSGNVQSFMTGNLTTAGIFNVTHVVSSPITSIGIISTRGKVNVQEVGWNQDRTAIATATAPVLENADGFSLGALVRGGTEQLWSNIDSSYFFAINKYLTTAELEQAEQYIADLCGVSL
jgi:hypothetical protein